MMKAEGFKSRGKDSNNKDYSSWRRKEMKVAE